MPPRKVPVPGRSQQSAPHQWIRPFLEYLTVECGMAQNSMLAYRSDLSQFTSWFDVVYPQKGVQEIDLEVLSAYLAQLNERKLSPTSIARHIVSIKMLFRYLVLEGIIAESLVELLRSPRLWKHLPRVLSPDTVDRLIQAPQEGDRYPLRDRAFLALLYATGCRVSEIANMKLVDVRLQEDFCRCIGKGRKERLVPLNPLARAALEAYLEHERPKVLGIRESDSLFVSRGGRPLTRMMLWELVKKYARRVGANGKVSPHTLRHSFATHLLAGGADIRSLQEMLGHANIATTQIYTQVEHSRLKTVHRNCHPRG